MAGILIIAHAPFASALRECVSHIYGGLPARIGVIDVMPDCDPVEVRAFARSEIDRLKEENGAVVLTDVFGATPANIAGSLASDTVRVLAGVNLPMLVRAVCYRTTPLDTLIEKTLQGGSKGIQELDASTPSNPCAIAACASTAMEPPRRPPPRKPSAPRRKPSPTDHNYSHSSALRSTMLQQETTIVNKLGLHARASAKLTQLAGSFQCEIWMSRNGRRINAKSIMGVMMLAAGIGSTVVIETEGADEAEAMKAVLALIADKFGEGQ